MSSIFKKCFCVAGDQTLSLGLAWQALYHLVRSPFLKSILSSVYTALSRIACFYLLPVLYYITYLSY